MTGRNAGWIRVNTARSRGQRAKDREMQCGLIGVGRCKRNDLRELGALLSGTSWNMHQESGTRLSWCSRRASREKHTRISNFAEASAGRINFHRHRFRPVREGDWDGVRAAGDHGPEVDAPAVNADGGDKVPFLNHCKLGALRIVAANVQSPDEVLLYALRARQMDRYLDGCARRYILRLELNNGARCAGGLNSKDSNHLSPCVAQCQRTRQFLGDVRGAESKSWGCRRERLRPCVRCQSHYPREDHSEKQCTELAGKGAGAMVINAWRGESRKEAEQVNSHTHRQDKGIVVHEHTPLNCRRWNSPCLFSCLGNALCTPEAQLEGEK